MSRSPASRPIVVAMLVTLPLLGCQKTPASSGEVVGGEEVEIPLSAGYVWYNPPGAWHAVRNTGATPLSLVFATVPNEQQGLLSFFRRISVEPGQDPIVLAPEDLERIAAEHDLILRDSLQP